MIYLIGNSIAISPTNGAIYVGGIQNSGSSNAANAILRRSATGLSGTFTTVDTVSPRTSLVATTAIGVNCVFVSSNNQVYSATRGELRKSSTTGLSGTYSTITHVSGNGNITAVAVSPVDGTAYICGNEDFAPSQSRFFIKRSPFGVSGAFSTILTASFTDYSSFNSMGISSAGKIYVAAKATSANNKYWVILSSPNALATTNPLTQQFIATGSAGFDTIILRRNLYDSNNTLLIDSIDGGKTFIDKAGLFNYNKFNVHRFVEPVITFSISASLGPIAASNIEFNVPAFFGFQNILIDKNTIIRSGTGAGWFDVTCNLADNNFFSQSLYTNTTIIPTFYIATHSGSRYSIRNAQLSFKEPLSDTGIAYYRNLDNPNDENIFNYVKTGVAKKIE